MLLTPSLTTYLRPQNSSQGRSTMKKFWPAQSNKLKVLYAFSVFHNKPNDPLILLKWMTKTLDDFENFQLNTYRPYHYGPYNNGNNNNLFPLYLHSHTYQYNKGINDTNDTIHSTNRYYTPQVTQSHSYDIPFLVWKLGSFIFIHATVI